MNDLTEYNVTAYSGYLQWAITLAFYHLRKRTGYRQAIKETIQMGGDTDTNAAIVGGIVGAMDGASKIPEEMSEPVLNYKYMLGEIIGYERPDFLSQAALPSLTRQLFEISAF